MKLKPIGKRVLVRKTFRDHPRGDDGSPVVFLPDSYLDTTNVCTILDVSDDCEVFRRDDIGKLVVGPELHDDMSRVGGLNDSEDFMIRERWFFSKGGHPYIMEPQ